MVKVYPSKQSALSRHRCLTWWNQLWNHRHIQNLCLLVFPEKSITLAHLFDTLLKCVPLNKPVSSNNSVMPAKDMMPQTRIVCRPPSSTIPPLLSGPFWEMCLAVSNKTKTKSWWICQHSYRFVPDSLLSCLSLIWTFLRHHQTQVLTTYLLSVLFSSGNTLLIVMLSSTGKIKVVLLFSHKWNAAFGE